jgi:cytochrome c oxidase assembly protein subunit 15
MEALAIPVDVKKGIRILLILAVVQILFGGLVSGMKAAMVYPTWPDMHGSWLPDILLDGSHWNAKTFLMYDQSLFMPALVQFLHRNTAYLILIVVCWISYLWLTKVAIGHAWMAFGLLGIVGIQLGLGILTLLGSVGSIPVLYGALHQGVGILFLTWIYYMSWVAKRV